MLIRSCHDEIGSALGQLICQREGPSIILASHLIWMLGELVIKFLRKVANQRDSDTDDSLSIQIRKSTQKPHRATRNNGYLRNISDSGLYTFYLPSLAP